MLGAEAFGRAGRRIDELPAAVNATLAYAPSAAGTVDVRAAVVERPVFPHDLPGLATIGGRVLFMRELRVDMANVVHAGELWSPAVRWAANRPRAELAFATPAPAPLPGLVLADVRWERQAYEAGFGTGTSSPLHETRRRAGAQFADWATSWLRWQAGAAVDRIGAGHYRSIDGHLDTRWLRDRLAVAIDSAHWFSHLPLPLSDAAPALTVGSDHTIGAFSTAGARVQWRSTTAAGKPVWFSMTGIRAASAATPLAEWPVAGSSNTRGALLRAHSLYDDGVIHPGFLGRTVVFGSLEYQHPLFARPMASVSVAGFVDTARAWQRLDGSASPVAVDAGAGARLQAGDQGGVRLDVAVALRTGEVKFSAGYVTSWPF
jgi:hypothetical protein